MLSLELSFRLRLNWALCLSRWAGLFTKSLHSITILGTFLILKLWFFHSSTLLVNILPVFSKANKNNCPKLNQFELQNYIHLFSFQFSCTAITMQGSMGSKVRLRGPANFLSWAQLSSAQKFWAHVGHYLVVTFMHPKFANITKLKTVASHLFKP